jgi:hypothetical protein
VCLCIYKNLYTYKNVKGTCLGREDEREGRENLKGGEYDESTLYTCMKIA